jgi:hypothetical protein
MKLTNEDFDRLWDASMGWGDEWRDKADRFDPLVSFKWLQAYWFEMSYANLLFAKLYLDEKGYDYEIASDEAGGWVILTNYVSEEVKV